MRTLRFLAVVVFGAVGIGWVSMSNGVSASQAGTYIGAYLAAFALWGLHKLFNGAK